MSAQEESGAEGWDLAAEAAREMGLFYDAEYRQLLAANPYRAKKPR